MSGRDEQIARVWEAIDQLKRGRVTYRSATVTAVDPVASTFDADVAGAGLLEGIPAGQLRPKVGDVVQLDLFGASPVYRPNRVGEGTIGRDELDDEVSTDITVALDTANGKNKVTYSTLAPSGSGTRVDDSWFQLVDGVLVGSWRWDGDSWEPHTYGDAMFDTITAAKITSGRLAVGVEITLGDPTGDHTAIDGTDGLTYLVEDPVDGVPNPISRFGRDAGGFDPATGRQTWAIPTDGRAAFQGLSVTEDPWIQGERLSAKLDVAGAGKLVGFAEYPIGGTGGIGVGELGTIECTVTLRSDRSYRLHVNGLNVAGDTEHDDVWLSIRDGGTGIPSISSPLVIGPKYFSVPGPNRYTHYDFDAFLAVATTGVHRLLLTVRRGAGGTGWLETVACSPSIQIYETGPHVLNTGVPNTGGVIVDPGAVQQREIVLDATWSATYNGSGALDTSTGTECIQGYTPYYPSRGNARAMVGFPDVTAALAGVPNDRIELVEISMFANHWHSMAGGTAVIGYHGSAASYPGSFSGTTNQIQVGGWGRGQRRTIDVLGWRAALRDGSIRGFTLGPGPSTSTEFYGRFNGAGMAEPPRLRIVYYK